jgi:hypothetical protein
LPGQVKSQCPDCRIHYVNGGPADVCLCCDGPLVPWAPAAPPPRPPRPELSAGVYWHLVLDNLGDRV